MKIYLVGGAVRDQLLGLPIQEKDWVVVGATPEALLAQGYQQVGKQFPVFLHPKSKEEFALARIESKSGHGYQGFKFDFNPHISLEEDLERRDLTINAMAMDENGQIIDPYGGQKDIQNKTLRHVSKAFVEDPLRVLRTARFHARFFNLGFHIAPETMVLMQQLVASQELNYLSAERVWKEWEKALNTDNPEIFFQDLKILGALPGEIANLPTTELAAISKLTSNPDIRLTIYLMPLNDLSILKHLKLPLHLQRKIELFKNEHQNLNIHQHQNAKSILAVLQRTDALRKNQEFLELLDCYEIFNPAMLNTQNSITWKEILQEISKIRLPENMQKDKNIANIQHYFETQRLQIIHQKVFSK